MSGNRKPKYNYKIFNKRTGKYMSWNRKGTWTIRTWVASRLRDEKRDELEVHIFPVAEPIIQTAASFLEEEAIAEMDKRIKTLAKEKKRKEEREHQQYLEDLRKIEELQHRINAYKKAIN